MSDSPIHHVSDTAYWVATYRADEGLRPDALFTDPLAARLVEGRGRAIAAAMRDPRGVAWSVPVRTCLIDDYLRWAIDDGCDTVVNLGAGLDTRPYRLKMPAELRWIEADFPAVLDFKEARLSDQAPRCQLRRVRLDLDDAAARGRLFDEIHAGAQKVVILTEGVVPYLSPEQAGALAVDLHARSRFRYWIIDYFSPQFMQMMRRSKQHQQLQQAPFRFDPPDWPAFFASRGFAIKEMRYLPDEGRRLGRPPPTTWLLRALLRFMPESWRESMRKFSGYALLERRETSASA